MLKGMPFSAFSVERKGVYSIAPKNHKRQRRKRQSVTAKREKSQTPKFVQVRSGKVSIAVKTFIVCDFSRSAVTDWRLWFLALMRHLPESKL